MKNEIAIDVKKLHKSFESFKKSTGIWASIRDLFKREVIVKDAVNSLSFQVKEGEFVGFLGPNGAGKTTTLKMLTGILTPTSGEASVLGYTPWKRKNAFKKQFSIVMGQKNQLWWDLPPADSYELFKHMYEIPEEKFQKNLKELVELMGIADVMHVQTRKLSLGQRMKAELVGALLHEPKVLLLDEPTIGLDVISQKAIRDFLKAYNKKKKATILLTSHYMEDIRQLCDRVMIIDQGELIFDGSYDTLVTQYAKEKVVELSFTEKVTEKALKEYGDVVEFDGLRARLQIDRSNSTKTLAAMLNALPIEDLSAHEQSMEEVVRDIFTRSKNV